MTNKKLVLWMAGLALLFSISFLDAQQNKPFYFYGYRDKGAVYANMGVAKNFNQPTEMMGYLDRAVAYINAGKYDLAISDCNKALELADGYPPAVGTRVLAYLNAGKYDLAFADIDFLGENFFSGSPNDAWLYYIRGKVNALSGNKAKAEADYKLAVELDPDYAKQEKYF
jgi:tetratricopeptide (TPR) repeat protein